MRRAKTLATVALGSAVLLPFVGAGTAMAADGNTMANLAGRPQRRRRQRHRHGRGARHPINVTMAATGLLADDPHAAHIHFAADARHECPTAKDDRGRRHHQHHRRRPGIRDIVVSLTKTGDTCPEAAWPSTASTPPPAARSPTSAAASPSPREVADAIAKGQSVVVVHGVDHNNNGKYDGNTKSDLDPSLPTEATDPAICGVADGGAGRRRGHRRRRHLEPDQHRAARPRRRPAARAAGSGTLTARRARDRG